MARISVSGVAAGVGVGLADLFLEKQEGKLGPFQMTPLISRFVIMGAGLAMQAFDFQAGLGREITSAAIPLLTKSLAAPVFGGARSARFARSALGRYPAPPIEPEIRGVRLV